MQLKILENLRRKCNMKNGVERKCEIISIILIFCISILFLASIPAFLLRPNNVYNGIDHSVWQTIGYMMKQGYLPYVDSFDHKGILLYFIHYWGSLINTLWGVSIFQFISIFITLLFAYKIACLKCKHIESIFIVLVAGIILINNEYVVGDIEMFSMSFIAISLYIFLDYLLNNKVSHYRVFITGICCGAVLLIKVNLANCWVVFCPAIFIKLIVEKRYEELKKYTLCFLSGCMLIICPCLIWALVKGCLAEFIESYIIFNSKYVGLNHSIKSFNKWMEFDFIILSMTICPFFFNKKNATNIIYEIYTIVAFLLIAVIETNHLHHGLTTFIVVIYPFSLIMNSLSAEINLKKFVAILLIAYMIIPKWYVISKNLPYKIIHRHESGMSSETEKICEIIKKNTDKNDTISVYGNWCEIYLLCDRKHATKYSFQTPIKAYDTSIFNNYIDQLYEEKPKIIVLQSGNWGKYDGEIKEFIESEKYELLYPVTGLDNDEAKVFIKK